MISSSYPTLNPCPTNRHLNLSTTTEEIIADDPADDHTGDTAQPNVEPSPNDPPCVPVTITEETTVDDPADDHTET